jgi:ubiquitin carboxyl-terminal hydrolase 34
MSLPDEGTKSEADSAPPRTPTRSGSHPPSEPPTSSRVTINLRTIRPLESIPSSPPSPITPSKMADGGVDTSLRVSVESESDALSTAPAIETPSSSPSAVGSPKIEIVAMSEDDDEFASRDPPLAIIDEDEVFIDPMQNIPYQNDGDTPVSVVRKVAAFWQYGMCYLFRSIGIILMLARRHGL